MTNSTVTVPELVLLPGGEFGMGDDAGRADERPAHLVALSPFRVAAAQITNADYSAFLAASGQEPPPFPAKRWSE